MKEDDAIIAACRGGKDIGNDVLKLRRTLKSICTLLYVELRIGYCFEKHYEKYLISAMSDLEEYYMEVNEWK
jgi:hypothetical protein